MKRTKVLLVCCVVLLFMGSSVQGAMVLTNQDAQVDSWNGHSGTSTALAAGDGAFAGERIWHSFMQFTLPTLAPGESFESAQLQVFPTNFWSWTSGDPENSVAAFRVWQTVNTWDNNVTWATQPEKFQLLSWPLADEGDLMDTKYLGAADMNTWISFDVLDAMASGTTISFAIDCDRDAVGGGGGGGIWFHSLEQGWGPRIEYSIVPEPATLILLSLGAVTLLRPKSKKA